jgi:uncharacterized protein
VLPVLSRGPASYIASRWHLTLSSGFQAVFRARLPGMMILDDKEIRALHEKYAPSPEAFELVYTHCEIVCDIAEQILSRSESSLNVDLVRAGSLLHDIGVYCLYDANGRLDHSQYVRHGLLGYELLSGEGFPEEIARFCSRHTGVGLTRADVRNQRLPLPVDDYLAESDEELIVMYADKFHSKTSPPVFTTAASYAARIRCFGDDKEAIFGAMRERFGDPDLVPLMAMYGHAMKEA